MNNFDKYKKLKTQYNLVYKGIHLNRVLSLMIWILANSKEAGFKWKTTAKIFFAMNVYRVDFKPNRHSILTMFGDWSRKEHLKIYGNIICKLGDCASYNEALELGHKFYFSFSTIVNFIKSLWILRGAGLTFVQKWKLSVHATYYCNTIDLLEKRNLCPQKFLCMCHGFGIDNLLTQYFKLKKIPTYSLQEGIYFLFGDNPPLDSILYENFETDNLLCWGQYTKDEYMKYGIEGKRLLVSGYPKDLSLSEVVIKPPLRKCLVLLARDSFNSSNLNLIDILSEFTKDFDFELKLHPSCDFETYSKLALENGMSILSLDKSINDCLNNIDYDFAIAVNTTVYYESLIKGLPCLRFHDDAFILMAGLDDVFTNSQQFCIKLHVIQTIPEVEYQKHITELLEYAIGYGKDNYVKNVLGEFF